MVSHNRHLQSSDPLLAELTRLYGVQTSYRDSRGRWRESPVESVVQVLRALGAELGDGDAGDPLRGVTPARMTAAIRERKRQLWSRVLEPVIVAWEGKLPPVRLRVLAGGHMRESSSRSTGVCPSRWFWREKRRRAEWRLRVLWKLQHRKRLVALDSSRTSCQASTYRRADYRWVVTGYGSRRGGWKPRPR